MSLSVVEYSGYTSLNELNALIRRYFKVATIVIIAKCSVEYRGRASSKAGVARRLIIIKEDGTVLIHEGKGREPINWQPQSHISATLSNEKLLINAIRIRPREELKIYIENTPFIVVTRLTTAKFILEGAERDLINMIASNPSLIEDGAKLVSREVSTPHGRVDVILRGKDGKLIIVEVKRSQADIDAVYQLKRYVEYYRSLGIEVRGVIASPKITPRALKMLHEFNLNYVKIGT